MSGYEVIVEALREAGNAATSAGEQAETMDLTGTLSGVGGALPGSRSAQAAPGASDTWRRQLTDWSTDTKKLRAGHVVLSRSLRCQRACRSRPVLRLPGEVTPL